MKYKDRKKEDKRRQEIIGFLPVYINQLILLLNSGMILNESMITIAKNHEKTDYCNSNEFARFYNDVYKESINTGRSMILTFNEFCKTSRIKELSRLAGILIDSDNRGVNLLEKLLEESDALWQQKKRIALENIRLAESKMSFPLGILLIALIIIAAAPAMMQMYI